jgi:hypothetical protein
VDNKLAIGKGQLASSWKVDAFGMKMEEKANGKKQLASEWKVGTFGMLIEEKGKWQRAVGKLVDGKEESDKIKNGREF